MTLLVLALLLAQGELEVETVESPAGPRSGFPNLARGGDERVYLSWIERGEGRVAELRYSAWNGTSWDAARAIAVGDDWFVNWADFPSVQALVDGTLIAHWLERIGEPTYAYGVRFVLSTDGEAWSAPRWLHDDESAAEHGFVSFVGLDAETFGALWLDGRNAGHDGGATALYYRTVSRTGDLGAEIRLDERVCDCCPTSMVRTEAGTLYAAYRDRTAAEIRDISIVRRARDGWSVPGDVHTDGWEMPGCPVNGPRLATDGTAVAAVWYTGAGEGAGSVLASFRRNGSFAPPRRIDDGAPEGRVDAVFLANGSLVAAWLEHDEDVVEWRVRRITSRGRPGPSHAIAPVSSGRSSGHLRMVADGDAVLCAWTSDEEELHTARLVFAD